MARSDGGKGMKRFYDRRLIEKDMAQAEMETMNRQLRDLAGMFGLAGDNVPQVIGASDQDAWVETDYIVAWGAELAAWRSAGPENSPRYQRKSSPTDLGGVDQFNLLEGRKVNQSDLRSIALRIGRHREMVEFGADPTGHPLWSIGARTFAKAVILEHLDRHGSLDFGKVAMRLRDNVADFTSGAPWTETAARPDSEWATIRGRVPSGSHAIRLAISRMEGRPLSDLISGRRYEPITVLEVFVEEDDEYEEVFRDDDDASRGSDVTITIASSMERLGKTPMEGDPNPVNAWLERARG